MEPFPLLEVRFLAAVCCACSLPLYFSSRHVQFRTRSPSKLSQFVCHSELSLTHRLGRTSRTPHDSLQTARIKESLSMEPAAH